MINFNEQQLQAINHRENPCMVVAGAGSGKSTVIVERVEQLITEKRGNMIVVTFTRNSAEDLKKKLEKKGIIDNILVGTFHSICGRILSIEGLNSGKGVVPYEVDNLFNKICPHEKVDTQDVLSFISYQKNYMKTYKDDFVYKNSKYTDEELRLFFSEYERYKYNKGVMDMDDMLLKAYDVLIKNPDAYRCDYLLVDEAQDCNLIQNKLIDLLCPQRNIMVVGDFKQSIYAFRGAIPSRFMEFDKTYPDAVVINLDYNYRSKKQIVENANKFIRNYYGDYKHYSDSIAHNIDDAIVDVVVHCSQEDEADVVAQKINRYLKQGVQPKEIAVLYRNNIQSQFLENTLKLDGIDYFIEKNGGFFDRKEISIILCMLRLIKNEDDNGAYETIVTSRVHYFKFFKKTFMDDVRSLSATSDVSFLVASELMHGLQAWQRKNILSFNDAVRRLSKQYRDDVPLARIIDNIINLLSMSAYLEDNYQGEDLELRLESVENLKKFIRGNTVDSFLKYVYEADKEKKKNSDEKIQLMTIHKSKGLEFKVVFIIGIQDDKFPSCKSEDLEEEARLMYVAVTRAKDCLHLNEIGEGNLFVNQYT